MGRQLQTWSRGYTIAQVDVRDPTLAQPRSAIARAGRQPATGSPDPNETPESAPGSAKAALWASMVGHALGPVQRRAKWLAVAVGPVWLTLHFGMTGRLSLDRPSAHDRLRLWLVGETPGQPDRVIGFEDTRRFGQAAALRSDPLALAAVPEPWPVALSGAAWRDRAGTTRRRIRDVLLDQEVVAGLGNICMVETLWLARVHPETPASVLGAPEWDAIALAAWQVIEAIVQEESSGIHWIHGGDGTFPEGIRVYGREGAPCDVCAAPIERRAVGGRGVWFCPHCQGRVGV